MTVLCCVNGSADTYKWTWTLGNPKPKTDHSGLPPIIPKPEPVRTVEGKPLPQDFSDKPFHERVEILSKPYLSDNFNKSSPGSSLDLKDHRQTEWEGEPWAKAFLLREQKKAQSLRRSLLHLDSSITNRIKEFEQAYLKGKGQEDVCGDIVNEFRVQVCRSIMLGQVYKSQGISFEWNGAGKDADWIKSLTEKEKVDRQFGDEVSAALREKLIGFLKIKIAIQETQIEADQRSRDLIEGFGKALSSIKNEAAQLALFLVIAAHDNPLENWYAGPYGTEAVHKVSSEALIDSLKARAMRNPNDTQGIYRLVRLTARIRNIDLLSKQEGTDPFPMENAALELWNLLMDGDPATVSF